MPLTSHDRESTAAAETMWPLDAAVAALAALITWVVISQLQWDDPRPLYNARTYVIGVPLAAIALDLVLRTIASRFVSRSMQVAFLVSVFVHLCLLLLAVNVVLFSRLWPEQSRDARASNEPVRRVINDYFVQQSDIADQQRDALQRPAEAEAEERPEEVEPQKRSAQEESLARLSEPDTPEIEQAEWRDREAALARAELAPIEMQREATSRQIDRQAASATRQQATSQPVPPDLQPAEEVAEESPPVATWQPARSAEREAARPVPLASLDLALPQPSADASIAARRVVERELPEIATPLQNDLARRPVPQQAVPSLSTATAPQLPADQAVSGDLPAEFPVRTPDAAPTRRAMNGAIASASAAEPRLAPTDSAAAGFDAPAAQRQTGGFDVPRIASATPRPVGRRRGQSTAEIRRPAGSLSAPQPVAESAADEVVQQSGDALENRMLAESGVGRSARARGTSPPTAALPGSLELGDPTRGLNRGVGEIATAREAGRGRSDEGPLLAENRLSGRRRFDRQRLNNGLQPPVASSITEIPKSFQRRLSRTSGSAMPVPPGSVGPETEAAIERGLQFLASIQNDDGSWSLQTTDPNLPLRSDTAATGLCLLAFQGAGYTHQRHQYASTVARGIEFLQKVQRDDGDLYRPENPASNQNVALYSHGIAALAICEAYGMTQDPDLRQSAQAALDFIAASQHPLRGGWRYQPGISSDTSVTGWMMMALKSGQLAGLEVDPETYEGIDRWMRLSQASAAEPYLFRYNPYAPNTPQQRHGRVPTPTMTAVGLLMRMYTGWRRENTFLQQGADYLLESLPAIGTAQDPQRDTYYWYYSTQVMFHMGGDYWREWNGALHPLLIRSQILEGPQLGSWDPKQPVPDRWAPYAGRLYVTAMNLLSLEVYYRHLPIYEETAR